MESVSLSKFSDRLLLISFFSCAAFSEIDLILSSSSLSITRSLPCVCVRWACSSSNIFF